jgi:pimeloyl-ACP methyl ester carboxylesterase
MERYITFGGHGPTIHLAPANGFPPEAYAPLAEPLTARFAVVGYRPRPLWPGTNPSELRSWHGLADDLLEDAARRGGGPYLGAGHSLGGVVTLYAAVRRPDLFSGLVLIDPVVLPRHMLPLIWAMRRLGQDHRSGLAQGAARRRHRFASLDEARARYSGRGAFAAMQAEALEGYLAGGLRPDGQGGLSLAWPREWEARIFSLVPIDTWSALARLRVPLLIIRGRRSDLLIDRSWRLLRRLLPAAAMVELDGGHMLPLERPGETAAAMLEWAATL